MVTHLIKCPACARGVKIVYYMDNPKLPQYARHYITAGVRHGEKVRALCHYSLGPIPVKEETR